MFSSHLSQNFYAKALFDNVAESLDELEFRKGDIVMVMDKNMEESVGWWKCSLHGREGLAPANRLKLLSLAETESLGLRAQNIYEVPKVPRPLAASPTYEIMDKFYKVPTVQAAHSNMPFPPKDKMPELPGGNVSPHRVGILQLSK